MNGILIKKRNQQRRQMMLQRENDLKKLEEEKKSTIQARYGRGKKYVDVTEQIKQNFVSDNTLVIAKDIVFDNIFRSNVDGSKNLILTVNGKEYKFHQYRDVDIVIRL